MPATVRQYELVYIVRPDLSEEQVQVVIDKYNGIITTQGGTIERTDIWERRRLAYEIAGQTEGIYIVCVFRGLPAVEAELRRVFRISEDTIRSIIVRPDEEIDTSVPSVQPRDYSQRAPLAPTNAPAPVAAAAAAAAAITPESGDSLGPAAGTATSVAAAASEAGVPGIAASDAGTEASTETEAAPDEAEPVSA